MKKANVQISFDAEKLGAIRQYMGKKEAELQTELEDFMQKLYEKHVPAPVRDYIESREPDEQVAPSRLPRPTAPARPRSHAVNDGE